MSSSCKWAGRLFQTRGQATAKLLSPYVLCVRVTAHDLSVEERSRRRWLSETRCMSSTKYRGACQTKTKRQNTLVCSQRISELAASATAAKPARYDLCYPIHLIHSILGVNTSHINALNIWKVATRVGISTDSAVARRLSVSSVCPAQSSIVSKRLNVSLKLVQSLDNPIA